MKIPRRKFLQFATAAVMPRMALAQSYPMRPITMVVPFPAGGGADAVARILAEGMRRSLGQPVVIENVGGAAGSIGLTRVARAASDGYTFILGTWGTFVASGVAHDVSYNLLTDFEPIAPVAVQPSLLVGKKALPADDLSGLLAWLKASPNKVLAGTNGVGSIQHVAGIYFQDKSGVRFEFIPYRGAAPTMVDLLSGQIDLIFAPAADVVEQVRSGNIKAYAVMAKNRLAAAPDIPTVDEAGMPGVYVSGFFWLWAPARTPKEIIAKLNAAAIRTLADPSAGARLAAIGQEVFPSDQQTPEALGALHKAEIEKWWPILKAANVKGQ